MINSKKKGNAGEREWAKFLREKGIEARRGQQFKGTEDSPDVVEHPDFHVEVKRVENLNILKAVQKVSTEAGTKLPYVAHRKNRCEWLVTMRAKDWITLRKCYDSVIEMSENIFDGGNFLEHNR